MAQLVALIIAFHLPAFHLVLTKDGKVLKSIEDMTLSECQARAKKFKPADKPKCIPEIVEREYT